MKTPKDLESPIHDNVIKNQSRPIGEAVFFIKDGLPCEYFHDEDLFIVERLVKRMKSEIGWFEKISSHGPSIGSFYESLIQSAILEVLPSNIKVGSGFVYDSAKRTASPQVDFIIYDDRCNPPIYKRGDFVVVDSKNVISCLEIKKTLTKKIIRDTIRTYVNGNLGSSPLAYLSIQYLNIFAFHSKITVENAFDCLILELKEYFSSFRCKTIEGRTADMYIYNLVLPKIYFFDRTGYISCVCRPTKENTICVYLQLNRSSLAGHSLGELLTSSISTQANEQEIAQKNFLTYPLIMVEKEVLVAENISVVRKISMDELICLFPKEADKLRKNILKKKVKPYAAIVPVSINLKGTSLSELEKAQGFSWLTYEFDVDIDVE